MKNIKMVTSIIVGVLFLSGVNFSFAVDTSRIDNLGYTKQNDTKSIQQILENTPDMSELDIISDELDIDQIDDITVSTSLQESLTDIEIEPSIESNYKLAAEFMANDGQKGIVVLLTEK